METKCKIAIVSYSNTKPFMYGLNKDAYAKQHFELHQCYPSQCFELFAEKKVDIGLLPVASQLYLPSSIAQMGSYCIGCEADVQSVVLLSNAPMKQIQTVVLDYQSKTSVLLTKVLMKHHWKKEVNWQIGTKGYETMDEPNTAVLVIGDRVFSARNQYKYVYDLGKEWNNFTGLPFVFALWYSWKKFDGAFIKEFDRVLSMGMTKFSEFELENKELGLYLKENISYPYTQSKKQALDLFLNLAKNL